MFRYKEDREFVLGVLAVVVGMLTIAFTLEALF